MDVVLQRLVAYNPKLFEIPSSEALSFQSLIKTVDDAVLQETNKFVKTARVQSGRSIEVGSGLSKCVLDKGMLR